MLIPRQQHQNWIQLQDAQLVGVCVCGGETHVSAMEVSGEVKENKALIPSLRLTSCVPLGNLLNLSWFPHLYHGNSNVPFNGVWKI